MPSTGGAVASDIMVEMQADVQEILRHGAELTDHALEQLLPPATQVPVSIHRAMRHSVFAGGKRLRPVLCIEAARMVAASMGPPEGVEELASALEMLHTYSLIHDDLPALDNDDLRRGKPTCHVVYGEAIAILAGDALQTQAYETLGRLRVPAPAVVEIVTLIAQATGTVEGMIGGQVLDLEAEGQQPTAELVDAIHRAKTGALIRVSLATGAVYGGGTPDDVHCLTEFGRKAGLAFQIVDDVLDMTQDSALLGKTAGKDVASNKATWPAVFGIYRSLADADQLINDAFELLKPYGERADPLKAVAQYLVQRKH
jgi:geranylgeranyl diphosphate synthase type II